MNRHPYIGVIRIGPEYRSRPGWRARIQRRHVKTAQDFYDGDFSGWRASRRAAIAWRQKMERSLPPPASVGRKARKSTTRGTIYRGQKTRRG